MSRAGADTMCFCGAGFTRPYPCGWRCTEHTPARLAGHPEPPEPAGRPWWVDAAGNPLPLSPLSTSWVHDSRAVASGRRASGARRRAAHAGEQHEQADRGEVTP